jgi:hypothetical protein
MKFFFLLALVLFFGCTPSYNIDDISPHYTDQLSGEDLFSQLSQSEKTMLGKWYFGYKHFTMQNETDSISYRSYTSYPDNFRTDTLKFYSKKFVGYSSQCPLENPTKPSVKVMEEESGYFHRCWPIAYSGWLIENETFIFYRGLINNDDFYYYPIQKINNDSIVFLYNDWPEENIKGIDKEYAVFYKD